MDGTKVVVTATMFGGRVKHDAIHPDDGGGWHVGHIDWWKALEPFDGKVVRVTIEVVDAVLPNSELDALD